jgi:hypothetical protein
MSNTRNRLRARTGDVVARVAVLLGLAATAGFLAAGYESESADNGMALGICDPSAPAPHASL